MKINCTQFTGEGFMKYFIAGYQCEITEEQFHKFLPWAVQNGVKHEGGKAKNKYYVKKL